MGKYNEIKVKLSQYYDVNKEIISLEKKINKIKNKNKRVDVVETSLKKFPYTKTHVKLEGIDPIVAIKIEKYNDILQRRLVDLIELQSEIELFISTIPTSRLRRIFELRYLEKRSWQKIAFEIGGNATVDSIRKEHDRFFK